MKIATTTLLCFLILLVENANANAQTNNPSATFLQGRVNLPYTMYNKGYYVTGSFQATLHTFSFALPSFAPANTLFSR